MEIGLIFETQFYDYAHSIDDTRIERADQHTAFESKESIKKTKRRTCPRKRVIWRAMWSFYGSGMAD